MGKNVMYVLNQVNITCGFARVRHVLTTHSISECRKSMHRLFLDQIESYFDSEFSANTCRILTVAKLGLSKANERGKEIPVSEYDIDNVHIQFGENVICIHDKCNSNIDVFYITKIEI